MCLLEATALFAGEPFSDHPPCVSRVLADFGISLAVRDMPADWYYHRGAAR